MKTEQQLRFEAAILMRFPSINLNALADDDVAGIRMARIGFQLGESSALERAAKVCDSVAKDAITSAGYDSAALDAAAIKERVAEDLADSIRALAQESTNGK
jgi:hypothetical protein